MYLLQKTKLPESFCRQLFWLMANQNLFALSEQLIIGDIHNLGVMPQFHFAAFMKLLIEEAADKLLILPLCYCLPSLAAQQAKPLSRLEYGSACTPGTGRWMIQGLFNCSMGLRWAGSRSRGDGLQWQTSHCLLNSLVQVNCAFKHYVNIHRITLFIGITIAQSKPLAACIGSQNTMACCILL